MHGDRRLSVSLLSILKSGKVARHGLDMMLQCKIRHDRGERQTNLDFEQLQADQLRVLCQTLQHVVLLSQTTAELLIEILISRCRRRWQSRHLKTFDQNAASSRNTEIIIFTCQRLNELNNSKKDKIAIFSFEHESLLYLPITQRLSTRRQQMARASALTQLDDPLVRS